MQREKWRDTNGEIEKGWVRTERVGFGGEQGREQTTERRLQEERREKAGSRAKAVEGRERRMEGGRERESLKVASSKAFIFKRAA